jgi:hypothetical protein
MGVRKGSGEDRRSDAQHVPACGNPSVAPLRSRVLAKDGLFESEQSPYDFLPPSTLSLKITLSGGSSGVQVFLLDVDLVQEPVSAWASDSAGGRLSLAADSALFPSHCPTSACLILYCAPYPQRQPPVSAYIFESPNLWSFAWLSIIFFSQYWHPTCQCPKLTKFLRPEERAKGRLPNLLIPSQSPFRLPPVQSRSKKIRNKRRKESTLMRTPPRRQRNDQLQRPLTLSIPFRKLLQVNV